MRFVASNVLGVPNVIDNHIPNFFTAVL